MPGQNFYLPNGQQIIRAFTFDDQVSHALTLDNTRRIVWVSRPDLPTPVEVLVWDLSTNILSAQGIDNQQVSFRLPRFNNANRPTPVAALRGALIFNTDTGTIQFCSGAVWSEASVTLPIGVSGGGTGQATLTAHGVLVGEGIAPISSVVLNTGQFLIGNTGADPSGTAALTSGQLLIGSSGANPVGANLTAGQGITIVNGAGSITLSTFVPRSYLAGCQLSNDGVSPNTVIDVSAGLAVSDDQTTMMNLSAITGTTGGTFVVGTGQPKLDTGAVAINTWYHVYVIERTDTGVVDILFSTNASSPTMPAGYTKKRRIGSFKTATGTTNILAFAQDGDYFRWLASVTDVSATNPGVAAVTRTLTVPLGVNVFALLHAGVTITTPSTSSAVLLSDLAANDEAPNQNTGYSSVETGAALASGTIGVGPLSIRTNTSQQIRSRLTTSDGTTVLTITTVGWIDSRGKNA